MTELRKIEPMGRRDPLLVLAAEISELRREQRLLKEEATKTADRLQLVTRAALIACILLSLELIVDLAIGVLDYTLA